MSPGVAPRAADYATGGWVQVPPAEGRLTLVNPPLQEEFNTQYVYRLTGDELLLWSGGFPWSGKLDPNAEARYVRVAPGPTPEMAALFEEGKRGWVWPVVASEPGTAAGRAAGSEPESHPLH